MPFTLRQSRHWMFLGGLWVLLTVLCALAGPFGTADVMSLPVLAGYWGLIVGISIAGSEVTARLPQPNLYARVAAWTGYAVVLTVVVFGLNRVLFPQVWQVSEFLPLLATIAISVLVIQGVIHLASLAFAGPEAPSDAPDPQAKFLRRLPLDVRAPLVRIEAQDHYLNVVTTKGSALILLRLAEAVDELTQAGGLQTHRSHWVKLDAVTGHSRKQGRDILHLADGTDVPVARSRRDAAKQAGLF